MHRHRLVYLLSSLSLGLLAACPGGDDGATGGGSDSSTGGSTSASTTQSDTTASTTNSTTDATTASTTMTTTTADSSGGSDGSSSTGNETGDLPPCPYTATAGDLSLVEVATGFDRPVLALGDPHQPDRLFVVEQGGDVRILEPGQTTAPTEVFLHVDVPNADDQFIGDERGLLGFAFPPNYPTDPRVYVAYTPAGMGNSPPQTVVEFMLDANDPNQVDPTTARTVIAVDEPAGNHNGGMIGFGPDGLLYIGLGDGGLADDAFNTGRNTGVLLSKLLRIDVEPDGTPDMVESCDSCMAVGPFDYTIPPDNPFVDDGNFAPEIYAWGFRNPWRFSWDLANGDLYVADVGQDQFEEVDVVVAGGDYGWSDMEGYHCFNNGGCDDINTPNATNADDQITPIAEYQHGNGGAGFRCSVTGGGVYRACEVDDWQGTYVYGDYCSGELFALRWDGTNVDDMGMVFDFPNSENIIGSGTNAWGDVYITTVYVPAPNGPIEDGRIYRLAPAP